MKWEEGRQKTGYKKLKLLESKLFKFDCYLLFFPKESFLVTHVDQVKGYQHHRLNIILWRPKEGGVFYCHHHPNQNNLRTARIIKFRPDEQGHGLKPITKGFRLVLSIGWLRKGVK